MMLFAEAMGSASVRSSLEVMLDTIRKKDEQQKDSPPALPTRPSSRGRLPSSRRSFPVNIALKSNLGSSERRVEVKEESVQKGGIFGCLEKSPDIRLPSLESYEERLEADGPVDHKCTSSSLAINLGGQFMSGEAIDYFLKKKLRVWFWLPEGKWECGKIHSASANDVHVLMSSGEISRLPFENILPANPELQDDVNDLALLSYINEPSLIHSLKYRYSQDMIYSKAGPVLVVLNPFKDLSLQANNYVAACQQKIRENPHVFAVVDRAFNDILKGGKNQSIIISGESGSGKTETAKIAMQRLVAIGSGDGIDFEVLKANAILESFGNAKTKKNDNSSRFGKLNEIHISQAGKICGARITTFLLEKLRVVQRAVGERSYHVFYQICAGAPPHLKAVANAANLLGCEVSALVLALSTQTRHSENDTIFQKLTLSQAVDTRDALAVSIYATLFDWVVVQINKSLQVGKTHGGSSISILDTCGFDVSHNNGFDQFSRNYASERMQQHFISHLLKHEQEEYTLDGVDWSSIDFADNLDRLNLFEKVKLSELIQQLENTNPHFIRCITPNSKQLAGIYEEDFVVRQLRSFSLLEVIRIARSGYPTRMTHEQFVERYHLLLMENTPALDPLSASVEVLQRYGVMPGMYQVGYTKIFFRTGQLAMLETARACTLQGILYAQKYFRGARARYVFNDIKNGITTLQSFIRAERARNEFHYLAGRHRAAILIQMHVKRWVAQKAFAKQQKHIMLLQSVIRGWLARKHFNTSRNLEMLKCNDLNFASDQSKKLHELEQEYPLVQHSDMLELKSQVLKAEAERRQKEEENSCLRQQLQQYEMRWSDYDYKMKSLEEMWQKQMTSLQMSLAAAKRSLASNDGASLAGRPDVSPNYPYFDSEDAMSVETYTTEGTPAKRSRASGVELNSTPEGVRNTISRLVKEFEERRQIFEEDAGFLVEVKSGLSVSNINPDEELSKLKVQFASWKKTYKVRLREAKAALQKLGNSETTKKRRKWWGNWSSK